MSETCMAGPEGLSGEEKVDRLLNAMRPLVADAMRKNNIRGGAKMNDVEANAAAAGDVLARTLMEAAAIEFGRATDQEVEEARSEALKKAEPELVSKLGGKQPRLVRQERERTLHTKRGPVKCTREYLYFPDLRVGLFPPRLSS